jgi:hypothetical protein
VSECTRAYCTAITTIHRRKRWKAKALPMHISPAASTEAVYWCAYIVSVMEKM